MSARCPNCRKFVRHNDGKKHLPTAYIPAKWDTKKATVIRYKCDPCKLRFYKLVYNQHNNPRHAQNHIILDDSYWNQGQWEKPTNNPEKPNNAAHCEWTEEVSQNTGSVYEKVIRRENRIRILYRDRDGQPLTWKRMAQRNRERLSKVRH